MAKLPANLKVWMFIPGMAFWALVGAGIATDNQTLLGAAVVVALISVGAGLAIKGMKSAEEQKRRHRVWLQGQPAKAVVRSIRTRGHFNDHPRVAFVLQVRPDEGSPYEIENETLISQLAVPRIQPEMELAARIDPNDRSFVVLDESLTPYGYA